MICPYFFSCQCNTVKLLCRNAIKSKTSLSHVKKNSLYFLLHQCEVCAEEEEKFFCTLLEICI